MLFDLHIHTSISSCGHMRIGDLIERAAARGLDGVCITDHNTMDIRHHLAEGVQENGLCVLFGMEYGTPQGDFLLFGPFEDLPPDLDAEHLLSIVRDVGGAAVAAHPFRAARPTDERIIRNGLCHGIECINGRNAPQENSAVALWRHYPLAHCGGSDAHTLDELGTFATRFLVPVRDRGDLIHAIRDGLCRPEVPLAHLDRNCIPSEMAIKA